jgi:hypothetical protein
VARIFIYEPQEDIRTLLRLVVSRLGHQAVVDDTDELDAAIVEPGADGALELARSLRERGVALVFASIFPAGPETLAFEPAAYLVKPFPLYALECALEKTLS